MQTQVKNITAAQAKAFLENNVYYEIGVSGTNRPINVRKVNQYAATMLKGEWVLTHQGLGFDLNGKMQDGQHRMLAVIQAAEVGASEGAIIYEADPKIKIPFQITYGLEPTVFDKLDIGLARSASQILAMSGYASQTALAASGRLLYLFDNHEYKFWRRTKVTNHEILETVKKNELEHYVVTAQPLTPVGFIVAPTTVGYYVCYRAFPNGPHDDFLDALRRGVNLDAEDPALVLRNYMIRSKSVAKNRRDAAVHLALYIKSWNDYVEGRRRNSIAWRSGSESFPKPVEKN